ncbi:MAG: DNA polymerase III subunit delta, partial [Actinomycetota bacterium]
MTASSAPVFLIWGEDAFLLREDAFQVLGDLRPTEVDAADWRGGELQDLATPSLFGEPRALLI